MRIKPKDKNPLIYKIETKIGYPVITWTDYLNYPRNFRTIYRKFQNDFYDGQRRETRPVIINALKSLVWGHSRDCLASATWLN